MVSRSFSVAANECLIVYILSDSSVAIHPHKCQPHDGYCGHFCDDEPTNADSVDLKEVLFDNAQPAGRGH